MLTNKVGRVLGFAGVVGAFAMVQACTPNSDDPNVRTQQGLSPQCTGSLASGEPCTPPPPESGGGTTTTKDGGKTSHPMPPEGYTVKWTVCKNWVEGDLKMRNNSRIVREINGQIPLTRAEPVTGGKDNFRRVKPSSLSKPLNGGKALDVNTKLEVTVYKIGQMVQTKDNAGAITQWVVSSWGLGEAVRQKDGRLAYNDSCYRNPKTAGRDTLGRTAEGTELANICVVEDLNTDYNALSAEWGWTPIWNFATGKVLMKNDPTAYPHPDDAYFEGKDPSTGASIFTYYSAALNDINGAERDWLGGYYVGDGWCHYIVTNGYEVPGAKRPATKSLPAPGVVNGSSLIAWRPVNTNLDIANDELPASPEPTPVEEEPAEAETIPDSDTAPL